MTVKAFLARHVTTAQTMIGMCNDAIERADLPAHKKYAIREAAAGLGAGAIHALQLAKKVKTRDFQKSDLKKVAIGSVAVIASVLLSGCASADVPAVLSNLEMCSRHYTGTVNGGVGASFTGAVEIDCQPQVPPPAPVQ